MDSISSAILISWRTRTRPGQRSRRKLGPRWMGVPQTQAPAPRYSSQVLTDAGNEYRLWQRNIHGQVSLWYTKVLATERASDK